MGEAKRRKQLGLMPTVFPFRAELGRDGEVWVLQGPEDAGQRALIEKALRDSQSFGAAWDAEYRTVSVLGSRSGERYATREDVERIPVPALRQLDGELALGSAGQSQGARVKRVWRWPRSAALDSLKGFLRDRRKDGVGPALGKHCVVAGAPPPASTPRSLHGFFATPHRSLQRHGLPRRLRAVAHRLRHGRLADGGHGAPAPLVPRRVPDRGRRAGAGGGRRIHPEAAGGGDTAELTDDFWEELLNEGRRGDGRARAGSSSTHRRSRG